MGCCATSAHPIRDEILRSGETGGRGDESRPVRLGRRCPHERVPHGRSAIVIAASNPEDVKAVHEFLRFQIEDHQTGDPLEPPAKN
jgi:hypothetical protein